MSEYQFYIFLFRNYHVIVEQDNEIWLLHKVEEDGSKFSLVNEHGQVLGGVPIDDCKLWYWYADTFIPVVGRIKDNLKNEFEIRG